MISLIGEAILIDEKVNNRLRKAFTQQKTCVNIYTTSKGPDVRNEMDTLQHAAILINNEVLILHMEASVF